MSSWERDGNNVGNNDFLGSTNNRGFAIKTNNTERVRFSSDGNIGVGTAGPTQRLSLAAGNMQLRDADLGTHGNLYFGGITDTGGTGMRLFGGLVNGSIPAGFIDVRSTSASDGLRIRVDTNNGGTERLRVTSDNIVHSVPLQGVSDLRLKEDVQTINDGLEKVCQIKGISYRWTSDGYEGRRRMGVVAQDVERVMPELVDNFDDAGHKAVDYSGLEAALVEAIKQLKKDNDNLRQRVEMLECVAASERPPDRP